MSKKNKCIIIENCTKGNRRQFNSVSEARQYIAEKKQRDLKAARKTNGHKTDVIPLRCGYIIGKGSEVLSYAYYVTIEGEAKR